MQRHVIIACAPEDERYCNKVVKWAQQGQMGERISAVALHDRRFYFADGSMNVELLAWTLKESPLVVILVGEYNWDHPWLDWEGEFCHQWGIKRAICRIPYTQGDLPDELAMLREIAYNPNAIDKEVRDRAARQFYFTSAD